MLYWLRGILPHTKPRAGSVKSNMAAASERDVKVHDSSENQALLVSKTNELCSFCKKYSSNYTCPRCNLRYCSIPCYRSEKHLQCSEDFYKESVMEELKLDKGSPEDAHKVMEMLKRLEDEGQGEEKDSDVDSIEERLRDIDLDNDPDALWEALSKEEQQGFHAAVTSGELTGSVTIWTPWWRPVDNESKSSIEVISTTENNNKEHQSTELKPVLPDEEVKQIVTEKTELPELLEKIQPLSSVLKTVKPNPAIKYSIIDVLYAYAYTMHLYNGVPGEDAELTAETLWSLSLVLSKNSTFGSTEMVILSCLNNAMEQRDLFNNKMFSCTVLNDVVQIINGYAIQEGKRVYFADCALSDVHQILSQGVRSLKKDKKSDKELEKKLWLAKKKVEFFLSWNQQCVKVLRSVAPHMKCLYHQEMASCELHESEKNALEQKWKGTKPPEKRVLIKEL